jgi:hypothetical protein
MKMFGLALLISATGIGVALQAQTPSTPTQTPSTSSNANKVTVTGCIQRASAQTPTGTSGTSGAAVPDTQFILANASAGTSTAGTSGTANPSSSAMSTAPRYRLDDGAESKITPHVGHKVEITGTVDEQSHPTGSGATAGATSSGAAAPKLKVDSIRMIASSCSE